MRTLRAAVIAAAIVVIASGCASSPHVSKKSADAAPLTCARFSKLSAAQQDKELSSYTKAPIDLGAPATTAQRTTAAYYLAECAAGGDSSITIDELSDATSDDGYPWCADYLKLDADTQATWATNYWAQASWADKPDAPNEAQALVVGCTSVNKGNNNESVDKGGRDVYQFLYLHPGQLAAYLAGQPGTAPAPTATAAPAHQIEWTDTSSLGYTTLSRVTWGTVSRGTKTTTHPQSSAFTLGSSCGYDPTKDAYVPGLWTVTNSTTAYSMQVSSTMGVEGTISTPGVSVALEHYTTSGPSCGFSNLPYAGSVQSNNEVGPGKGISVPLFIIIKNYYSPAFPNGDTADLAKLKVQQTFIGGGVNAPLG